MGTNGTRIDHVQHVAYGRAGFLALGFRQEGGEGGLHFAEAYAWMSLDAETWDEVAPPPLGFIPDDLWVSPTGEYVVSGTRPDESGQDVVLRSTDGVTWSTASTGLPAKVNIAEVASGPRGYLLVGQGTEESDPTLWLSADGLSWELTHEFSQDTSFVQIDAIGAGDDGFVGLAWRGTDETVFERFAFASADGRDWVETPKPFGTEPENYRATTVLAPFGPDWIAVIALRDGTLQVWSAPNASAWESTSEIGTVDIGSSASPVLVNVDGTLFFSVGGDASAPGSGTWSSTDGVTWTEVDIGSGAASDATGGGGAVVLAGHAVVGEQGHAAAIWATPAE